MTSGNRHIRLAEEVLGIGTGSRETLDALGRRVFSATVESYRVTGSHPRPVIEALSDLASSGNPNTRRAAETLIFRDLVEGLSDAFEPDLACLYDALFSQIIDRQRQARGGELLDEALHRFGLRTEEDIRNRRLRLRSSPPRPVRATEVRKIFVFSRVTVGADVAITSVIMRKLLRTWPEARILLAGPARAGELFAGDPGIGMLEVPYPRHGSLLDRLSSWVGMLGALDRERGQLAADEVLFVDTDSRLTQLGLLPVTGDAESYIFESRTYGAEGQDSLGELAARWAEETFGRDPERVYPYVSPDPAHLAFARESVARLRRGKGGRVVALNFGVGGNPGKRVGEEFEARLLRRLLAGGHTIVLDKGIGGETAPNDRILAGLRGQGARILEMEDRAGRPMRGAETETDVLTWSGGIGVFSSLIAASDLYVGYDSAFQHIAAALAVPVVAVVPGSPGPLFRRRWTPCSRAAVRIVPADDAGSSDPDRLLGDTLAAIADSLR